MNVNFNKMLETLIFQRSYAQYFTVAHKGQAANL